MFRITYRNTVTSELDSINTRDPFLTMDVLTSTGLWEIVAVDF